MCYCRTHIRYIRLHYVIRYNYWINKTQLVFLFFRYHFVMIFFFWCLYNRGYIVKYNQKMCMNVWLKCIYCYLNNICLHSIQNTNALRILHTHIHDECMWYRRKKNINSGYVIKTHPISIRLIHLKSIIN